MDTIINRDQGSLKHLDLERNISAEYEESSNNSDRILDTDSIKKKFKNQEIIKNMEAVLSLVKKKHKNKHKTDKKSKHHKHKKNCNDNKKRSVKSSPGFQKDVISSSRSNRKKSQRNLTRTIQDLLSPEEESKKPRSSLSKKLSDDENIKLSEHVNETSTNSTLNDDNTKEDNQPISSLISKRDCQEEKKKVNAFEFLMNARSKSIGGNSPDKYEGSYKNENIETDKGKINLKRKLVLEEWAERKGAKKRKLKEAVREQYIEEQMEKRAKRLRKMIESPLKVKNISKKNCYKTSKKSKEKNAGNHDKNLKEVPEVSKEHHIKQFSENKSEKEEVEREKKNVRRSIRNSRKLVEINNEISTDEFLINLSSPMKGKHDLYGYFEKTTPSPKEHNDKNFIEAKQLPNLKKKIEVVNENSLINASGKTMSKRGRKKKALCNQTEIKVFESKLVNDRYANSERPRRSCVGKARYDINDYELDSSLEKSKVIKKKNINIFFENDTEEEVIVVDCATSPIKYKENGNILLPKKLAPLFVKAIPKPCVDPETLKARQNFLMSGIPEKMKIDIIKMKQFEQNYEYRNFFPEFNHVPLWVFGDDVSLINWSNSNIFWRKDENEDRFFYLKNENLKHNVCLNSILTVPKKKSLLAPLSHLKTLENKQILIKLWKKIYDRFPTYKCYNQLREKYRYFSAMDTAVDTHEVTESFVVSTSRNREPAKLDSDIRKDSNLLDNVKPPSFAPNGELQFCDKYKPLVLEQILVNVTPVIQLKEFLSGWQSKNKAIRSEEVDDSSFECMNESNSTLDILNCIVLVGPPSSGKTNAVFALANELNFNVLEINAGMKRNGKKLLQDLQEATQSHQIRKDSKKPNLLQKSISTSKKIRNSSLNENSTSSEFDANTKMSLILVEDADVLFENHDQGFVEAIYQLVGISKRPVVILANNKNCVHLQKLINQNCIEFSNPNSGNISKFLTILSLIENCPIHIDDIISLYYYNKMDLRKTILEIQFFVQSGGDRKTNEKICFDKLNPPIKSYFASPKKIFIENENLNNLCKEDYIKENISVIDEGTKKSCELGDFYIHGQLFEFFTTSQNIQYIIPFPINFNLLWVNVNEILKSSKIFNIQLNNFTDKTKMNTQNCKRMETLTDFYDNVSIASNVDAYQSGCGLIKSIEDEIAHYLVEGSTGCLLKTEKLSYNLFDEKPRLCENILSYISSSNQRSKRSISLDIEPMLRSICRSERTKSNKKRVGSRYYHYLRNIALNMNSFSLQLFDDVCPIFVDNPEDFIENKQFDYTDNGWLD